MQLHKVSSTCERHFSVVTTPIEVDLFPFVMNKFVK